MSMTPTVNPTRSRERSPGYDAKTCSSSVCAGCHRIADGRVFETLHRQMVPQQGQRPVRHSQLGVLPMPPAQPNMATLFGETQSRTRVDFVHLEGHVRDPFQHLANHKCHISRTPHCCDSNARRRAHICWTSPVPLASCALSDDVCRPPPQQQQPQPTRCLLPRNRSEDGDTLASLRVMWLFPRPESWQ